jgi:hypothetical protein
MSSLGSTWAQVEINFPVGPFFEAEKLLYGLENCLLLRRIKVACDYVLLLSLWPHIILRDLLTPKSRCTKKRNPRACRIRNFQFENRLPCASLPNLDINLSFGLCTVCAFSISY